MTQPERRQFPRIPQPLEARYRITDEVGTSWHTASLINLGAGGMRFRGREPLEKRALLELELTLPGQREPLFVKGAVVWSTMRAAGVVESGVEFIDVSPERQIQVDTFVQFLRGSGRLP